MQVNPFIFREYDIRGHAGNDLNDAAVELIGKAYGTYISSDAVIIGMDNRLSSERIKKSLIKGLISTGKNVIDIGLSLSPIVYYSTILYDKKGAIMITGSHIPSEYNGFKICRGPFTLVGKEIRELLEIIKEGNFISGQRGKIELRNPLFEYEQVLKDKIKLKKKIKVVLDCWNGTAGIFAPKILKNWGCEVIPLYCESNGNFPNHNPDPTKIAALQDLIRTVRREKADLGIGIDGDGDRLGIIDDKANIIWGDMLQILYQREILAKHPGEKVIIEVKCSQALYDDSIAHGGEPIFWKTGHSLIKAKMLEEKALMTGEMSGHMFFMDEYYGFDDALYAAGRLLRIIERSGKSLSELLSDAPHYLITPELRPYCADEIKFEIVKKIVKNFKEKYKVIDIDGARIVFEDGWGLIRASNTQPALIIRAEGKTAEALERIKRILENELNRHEIEFDWNKQGD